MKFVLQGEYCTLNEYSDAERTHYRYGASIKKAETNRAALELKAQWDGTKPKVPVVMRISWFRKNRRTDPDNIVFAKKFIIDGFVKAGILENDGWNQIVGFEEDWGAGNNPRVEIELI